MLSSNGRSINYDLWSVDHIMGTVAVECKYDKKSGRITRAWDCWERAHDIYRMTGIMGDDIVRGIAESDKAKSWAGNPRNEQRLLVESRR